MIVLADKAYDADRIRELIEEQGATPNIPPKSNRGGSPASASGSTASAT
jgi:transposase